MRSITLAFFIAFLPHPAICQLGQLHPELCGAPGGTISLPRDFSATVDRENFAIKFLFTKEVTLTIPAVIDGIDEACPLLDGRIVVFAGTGGASGIYLLDGVGHSLMDVFAGYRPTMSPNRRWISYRKPYPSHGMELPVSEEYLVYDLSRNPSHNRAGGVSLEDQSDVGIPIFPLGQKNLPGDHIGLSADQRHDARSEFFWSPDSKVLMFADGLLGKLSLVLITIDDSGAHGAFVHPVDGIPADAGTGCAAANYPVSNVEFGPEQGRDRVIFVDFAPGCAPQPLQIYRSDFQLAKPETHLPLTYTRKSIRVEP